MYWSGYVRDLSGNNDPDLLEMVIEEAESRGYDVSKLIWVDQSRNIEELGLEVERVL